MMENCIVNGVCCIPPDVEWDELSVFIKRQSTIKLFFIECEYYEDRRRVEKLAYEIHDFCHQHSLSQGIVIGVSSVGDGNAVDTYNYFSWHGLYIVTTLEFSEYVK